jgi:ATP synthase protein I
MTPEPEHKGSEEATPLGRKIAAGVRRKQRSRRDASGGIWSGLSLVGMVGWSVALPMLIGALLGLWLDRPHPGQDRWTLVLLLLGLAVGCLQAWRWIVRQNQSFQDEEKDDE